VTLADFLPPSDRGDADFLPPSDRGDADFGYPVYVLWITSSQRLLNYLTFQSFDYGPEEGYSRNESCSSGIKY
jgi:hypothetical protein